ncbi:MAG: TonB-dependent receptor [Spongiibacteraceae bacterium]
MKKIGKRINHACLSVAMLPTAALSIGLLAPLNVAQAAAAEDPTEIIVTARREKEELQKVPISMTVFTQESLSEKNVTNGADLVAYTPSLNVNQRFGSDQASFAIRGFSQDLRTTASVAVYFADVVAPRSGGSVTAGDGAGPGAFFDLQNVQVLKGPQGTLFGRNTTGGAIQLVPQEPTSKLEGYLEASTGNYNMRRWQGVLNVPVTDSVRARFGFDKLKRDGYVINVREDGPRDFSNVDYIAGRASVIVDVTDTVQNYTVFQWANSENNGSLQRVIACGNNKFGTLCTPTLDEQEGDFYNAVNADHLDPVAKLKQSQFVNSTTWTISDDFEIKNILGYADLLQTMRGSVFGIDLHLSENSQTFKLSHFPSGQIHGIPTNSQETFVEELRFSGNAFDQKLNWQAGLYYEDSRPDGWSGSQSPGLLACQGVQGDLGSDPAQWSCYDSIGFSTQLSKDSERFKGSVERQIGKMEYNNQAAYAQGTYDLTDELKFTLGLRYTIDKTEGTSKRITYLFNDTGDGVFGPPTSKKCSLSAVNIDVDPSCRYRVTQKSEAPTWMIGLDYSPISDVLLYTKYTRGYRQGSLVLAAPDGFEGYDPEKVDAYEIGAKTKFNSFVSGTFNISLFYNALENQQLQLGVTPQAGGSATTTVVNAKKSTIKGGELETTLRLFEGLTYSLSYTYLETRLDEAADIPDIPSWNEIPSAAEGAHLTFSPRHAVTTGLNYRLPLPLEVGDISVGVVYSFMSSQLSSASRAEVDGSPYSLLPPRQLLNLNMGWKAIFGSPFDAQLFMTNARDEEYNAYVAGLYVAEGAEFAVAGEPRMYGARIKYNFGF